MRTSFASGIILALYITAVNVNIIVNVFGFSKEGVRK